MTDTRRSDAQFERTLRSIVPSSAPSGLLARIQADVETTEQAHVWLWPLAHLTDADPLARRRALILVAAALLAATAVVTGGIVGSMLVDRSPLPIPAVTVEAPADQPPADLPAFVQSTYERMPELAPVAITVDDNGTKRRVLVSAEGAVRIETYASPDATEPETYRILAGTSLGETLMVDGQPKWYQQAEAISEDPRVFVYATMGAAAFGAPGGPGCETAISPGEIYANPPGRRWRWVGIEEVAGRPAHHVQCDGELWIDAETGLTLRSRGPALDEAFQPIPGSSRTVEATQVVFEAPPAALFEIDPPAGMATIDAATYECLTSSTCMASPAPVITPPPATAAGALPEDLDALVAASIAATTNLSAFDVTVEDWMSKIPGSTTRVVHDGAGQYRRESTYAGTADPPWITLDVDGHYYYTEMTTDGVQFWRETSTTERELAYPLRLPDTCDSGWMVVGVDLILERPADHLACPGDPAPTEFWIDRETGLVVRTMSLMDEQSGVLVEEVTDLRFEAPSPELFALPPGADLRPG